MQNENNENEFVEFHKYLESVINHSNIKQNEIAAQLGYEKPNIITMFKQGKTKMPIEKVPAFARVMGLDPKRLLRHWLSCYDPALLKIIEEFFGDSISKNERDVLNEIRALSVGREIKVSSIASKEALSNFVKVSAL